MSEKKGYVFMFIVAILHSLPVIAIKYLYHSTNAFTTQMFWFLSASLWTLLVAILLKKKNLIKEIKKNFKILIFFSITNTIGILGFFYGLTVISPGVMSFLDRFGTLFTIILGVIILKEKFNKKELIGMIISIIGIFILSYSKNPEQILTSIIFLSGMLVYAYGYVIIKKNVKDIDPFTFMFIRSWFMLITMVFLVFFTKSYQKPDLTTIPIFIILPLLSAVIGQILNYSSLRYIGISKAALINNLQPFIIIILSYFLLNDLITNNQILGGILVVFGLSIIVIFRNSKIKDIEVEDGI